MTGRNFRSRYGEVDLIAQNVETLVFVEVKAQRGTAYGALEESVTPRKRERLTKTAQTYLQKHGLEQRDWRIDVVAITSMRRDGPAAINHLRGVYPASAPTP